MPIAIDPKQDTLPIPIKLYKPFVAELVKTYTNQKLKDEVKIEDAKIQGVVDSLKDLNDNTSKLNDDNPPVLFHFGWNKSFKDKDSSQKLYDFIKDKEIKDLSDKSETELQGKKRLAANLAVAAKAALDEGDSILKAYAALNTAVDTANKATPAPTPVPAPVPVTESIINRLKLDKTLYEAGFIERSEYLASIVKTKNLLKEAAAPAAAPAAPATPAAPAAAPAGGDVAKARAEFGTTIANFASPNADTKFKRYMGDLTKLQDFATKASQQQINEFKKRLIKNLIKKKILSEAATKENKKEYLNEILGLLLGAALVALGAWIGKKFSQYFTTGPAVQYKPSSNYLATGNDTDNEDFTGMMQDEYTDPLTGKVVDQQGKTIDSEETKKALQTYISAINSIATLHTQNLADLAAKLPACKYDATNQTAIQNALNAIPKTIEKGKTVIPQLEAYVKA